MQMTQWRQRWCSPAVIAVFFFSFASSLPLVLVGSTLQAWYTVSGVDLLTIGMLTLVGQPYAYKFLWAPLMDRFAPLTRDRRRGWILIAQFLLLVGLVMMALLSPTTHPWLLGLLALVVAFVSASQDIAIDAYRVDVLHDGMQSIGAAVTNVGGRFAMLVGGAFALILADKIGWRLSYLIMAGFFLVQLLITWWSPKPQVLLNAPASLSAAIVEPIRDILQRKHAVMILIFIVIYKICDAFAFALNTTFLIRGVGFSLQEVAMIYKLVSLVAVLSGSFVGGIVMQRLGMYKSLLYFGILQAVANLAYMALAVVGKNMTVMILSVFSEYFCSGLATVAFLVFLMSLCDKRYSAVQFALFSALAAIGRVFAGPEVALMVEHLGWATFYFLTFLFGFPAVLLLLWLRRRLDFDCQLTVVA